ncbi:IS1 family transposase [Candidatus Leptofilum sp.]|uniref:IS1 family transposase n=1 Tax=Candidatus Leptofilum sp. TaxID=3241576 RepID=UPI003B5911F6
MTVVDRQTRCFLGIEPVLQRTQAVAQKMIDEAPAEQYYSDKFPLYDSLIYRRGYHLSLRDKSETYSVEGGNAELRHYLTRLVRKSRCFSRSLVWLNRHVKAFAHAWNRRQLHNRMRPFDKKHVIEFVCLQN